MDAPRHDQRVLPPLLLIEMAKELACAKVRASFNRLAVRSALSSYSITIRGAGLLAAPETIVLQMLRAMPT